MYLRYLLIAFVFLLPLSGSASIAAGQVVWLETLDLSQMSQSFGSPGIDKSVGGNPLTLGGKVYAHGVGTHAQSDFQIKLHGDARRFSAVVGVDDEENKSITAAIKFEVILGDKIVAQTPIMHGDTPPQRISVDLIGAKTMSLRVMPGVPGIDDDHADWADAEITLAQGATVLPTAYTPPIAPPRMVMLPPNPHPAIHGARITGATPGHPFLFLIPATGRGPLTYAASPLPAGLTLNAHTGILSGALRHTGRTIVHLVVRNSLGVAKRDLTVVGGRDMLALTPPMGWNSWNVWAGRVNEARVKAAANEMISSGLAAHGYQYINIDDTWEGGRNAAGDIQSNSKFPDMKALTAYIHVKGLKVGLYSSPGPKTCGGYMGSYQHEEQDAQSYANWGFDYLKYDWCSYDGVVHGNHSLPALEKPYLKMHEALDTVNRDIVFSLCQYGMGDVWKWGASVGGNTWRTTGDINDNWSTMYSILQQQQGLSRYAGPGHWNDPDMLEVGIVGKGNPHPNRMTPNELITHISMWSMLAAPLLIGCDMTKLDPFTLALLENDEVINIDQDPLGKEANLVQQEGDNCEVWARPLNDGSHAVALINGGDEPQVITARWVDCGISGKQLVRDLWLHKNVGYYNGSYSVLVPTHGAVLLKIGKAKR